MSQLPRQYNDSVIASITQERLILLVGARQIGKTTLLQYLQSYYVGKMPVCFVTCDQRYQVPFTSLVQCKQRLLYEQGFDVTKPGLLLLDEIQQRPDIDLLLKSLYDDGSVQCRIVATGSRFWGQRHVGASLVGRGKIIHLFPLSFKEFLWRKGKNVDTLCDLQFDWIQDLLQEYLTRGGYPAVVLATDKISKQQKMESIIETWLQKDFSFGLSSNLLSPFRKLLGHIALNTGNLYKPDQLASNIGVSTYHINQMIQFVIDSYLVYTIPPFYQDKSKEYSQQHELFFHDMGLLSYIGGQHADPLHNGKAIEMMVMVNLIRVYGHYHIHFYKKKSGAEIDALVRLNERQLIPIEIKAGNKDTTSIAIKNFVGEYIDKVLVSCMTSQSIYTKGDHHLIIPYRATEDIQVGIM